MCYIQTLQQFFYNFFSVLKHDSMLICTQLHPISELLTFTKWLRTQNILGLDKLHIPQILPHRLVVKLTTLNLIHASTIMCKSGSSIYNLDISRMQGAHVSTMETSNQNKNDFKNRKKERHNIIVTFFQPQENIDLRVT